MELKNISKRLRYDQDNRKVLHDLLYNIDFIITNIALLTITLTGRHISKRDRMNITNKSLIGISSLSFMGIAAIFSLRNLPIAAMYGYSSISYYALAALLFFIPSAVVCSFLAKHILEQGGIYAWVCHAFGKKTGFVAIWFEWINTVIAFPMMIGFILFTIIFSLEPGLANNKFFAFGFFLLVFWGLTLVNFLGIKFSSLIGSVSVVLGTIIPAILIIVLGAIYYLGGYNLSIHYSAESLLPNFHLKNLAFLIAIINGLSGIQVIAFHRSETINPRKSLPIAMFIIACVILTLAICATMAIAIVLPHNQSSIIGGLIVSFNLFLSAFHLQWLTPIIAILIAIGVISEINAWIIGPSKGMLAAALNGQTPKLLAKTNNRLVPTNILILQAITGSILGGAYLLMPSVNSAYWLLSDLTGQFTLLMWLLVFSACIYLNFKNKHLHQKLYYSAMAAIGFIVCLIIFIVSYIPPEAVITKQSLLQYEIFLIGGMLVFLCVPFGGHVISKPEIRSFFVAFFKKPMSGM